MNRIFTLLVFALSTQAWAQSSPESYTIYSMIINEDLQEDSTRQGTVLIQGKTNMQHAAHSLEAVSTFIKADQPVQCAYPSNLNDVLEQYPALKDLVLALNSGITKNLTISNAFKLNAPLVIMEPKDFFKKFKKNPDDGWRQLRGEIKDLRTIVELSQVEIQGDFAAVYYGAQVDPFHGTGSLIILHKIKGEWMIIAKADVWVS